MYTNTHLLSRRLSILLKYSPWVLTHFGRGSTYHDVQLWNMNANDFSEPLTTVKPHTSFLQQNRSSPVTGLAFHPHRMMLACSGAGDSHISLFCCDGKGGI